MSPEEKEQFVLELLISNIPQGYTFGEYTANAFILWGDTQNYPPFCIVHRDALWLEQVIIWYEPDDITVKIRTSGWEWAKSRIIEILRRQTTLESITQAEFEARRKALQEEFQVKRAS